MQAATTRTPQRETGEQARARAIIRFNGLMFHGLTVASFMETAVTLQVSRLYPVFSAHPDVLVWLEKVWLPQRAERGRRLREYVEATWPEFDWNAAYDEFCRNCRGRAGTGSGRGGAALEALGLCAAAVQAALFYRAHSNSADDPALRGLAREAAADHAACFDYFRAIFERCKRRERVGFVQSWRVLAAACRRARDFDVRVAFELLESNWKGQRTVPDLAYGEFVHRMAQTIQRNAGTGRIERILFRPWLTLERATPAPSPAPSTQPARLPQFAMQAA